MKKKESQPFVLFIASLGIYIIIIGILGYLSGYESIFLSNSKNISTISFLSGSISPIQVITIFVCFLLFFLIYIVYSKTKLGAKIRAISSNRDLSLIFGINSIRISIIVNIITTFLFL